MRRLPAALALAALACGEKEPVDTGGPCQTSTWFADADADGFGDPAATTDACTQPSGTVDNADDCDDADPSLTDGVTWYLDADGDGHGGTVTAKACDAPSGHVAESTDCDDSDETVWESVTAYVDEDGDGYGGDETVEVCGESDGTSLQTGDCDDARDDVHPGADEPCSADEDLDCDGELPDGDQDDDGEDSLECGGQDCDDGDASVHPGAEELCDDVDQDCDGDPAPTATCALESCLAWLNAGETNDGEYLLDPEQDGADPFVAYCDMSTDGGGWTLLFSAGTSFDETDAGVDDKGCYDEECTNLAYSTLPIGTDLLFDMADSAITGASYSARAVVTGVGGGLPGITLQEAFTTGSQRAVEADDNSNVSTPDGCGSWQDFSGVVCSTDVLTLADQDSNGSYCPNNDHLIGASRSSTVGWDNCAGWPDAPNFSNTNYYPDNFRVWSR